MRYEDASHTGAFQGSEPIANDDLDAIAAGQKAPATGNVITGEGTQTGSAGADSAAGAHITSIAGKGGEDSSFSGGKLSVAGEHGKLSVDAEGNYSYLANAGVENVRDRFTYTLADNQGNSDTAALIIEIGKTPVVIKADAQQIVVGPDGVVTLPPGVELSDIMVVGRNLVINMPDGTQLIIIDGAVFVPQLVLNGVEIPATNVAALLIGQEIQPAAGETPQSGGGNFALPPPPLDPGVPLGDLIPPTELTYVPPEPQEVFQPLDEEPEAGAASAQLDDDAQPGGNPLSNVGDDPGGSSATGSLLGSGGDGSLSWDLLTTGAPAGFSYADGPNGSINVFQNGNPNPVLNITVDPATGEYTVTQLQPLDHPAGGDENNLIFVIDYTVTDDDGDIAAGTLTINVDDDTPSVSVQAGSDANVILTTDDADTIGAASDTVVTSANFGGVFSGTTAAFGADGAGPGTSSTYALAITGSNSGLMSHGVVINLYVVGGVVVGSTAASAGAIDASNTIFTVSTSNTGVVTLTQLQQIDHAAESPSGSPFNDQFTSMVDGLVTLTRSETVVDGDGDQVTGSASVNIGANLRFTDDGPTIGLADRGEPTLTVDETVLGTNATASFAANFAAVFGADGPAAAGSITYALGISAPGANSGLIDVATGSAIVLVLNGNVVEGHVGNAAGALAFTVSVDASGNVTLDQIRALQHPNPANPDDNVTLSADTLVTLTATAHDFDGDTASSTLNIGSNLNFEDDGPSISASTDQPSLTVDETVLATNATASFAGVFTSSFGADGAGTVSYALGINAGATGLVDVATGEPIVLVLNGGVVEGHVGNAAGALAFTVSIDASGNVTLDQIRALQHPNPANPDDSVTLANDNLITIIGTVTDKDGDQASATANIGQNLNFEDDGPSIALSGTEASLTVDETNLAANATAAFAAAFLPLFGADGAGTVTYALSISAPDANSGLIDVATGSAIVLVNNAGVIEGHVGNAAGPLAFTVSVNAAGDVTLDQIRAVQHPNPADPDDSVTLSADNLVALTATVTDRDGDQASATLNIGQNLNFEDDGPTISASSEQPTLTVDETVLATNATASFAGVFTSSFGADGAGTITYALGISAPGADSGLIDVATGQAIVLVNNAGVIEGHVGNAAGALAFTASVDAAGNVTLDQIRALTHPNAANPDDAVTLSADTLVTLTATITDRDGDQQSATANIGTNLVFEDDGPTISASTSQPTLTVDETVLATNASASFAAVFTSSFGADGAGTITYALSITGGDGTASGLIDVATGSAIVLVNNAGVIEGHVGNAAGALAFTVSVDASGNVTLDQIRALSHPNAANPDDAVTLSADNLIVLTATITDRDGDQQSAAANIGTNLVFEDDGPSANNDSDSIVSGGTSATGNVITGVGTNEGAGNADAPGADGFGSISGLVSNGTANSDTNPAGGFVVVGLYGTLSMDASGNYTYTRADGSPGNVSESFNYTYVDGDGDPATATLTINIADASPNAPAPVVVLLDDDTLLNGNPGGPGDRTPDTQNTTGNLVATGGDGDLDYFISASQTLPTGFTSNLSSLAGVQTLQIFQDGILVITVTLTNETGAYTVTQNAPIMHALDGNTEGEIPVGNILSAINVNVFAQDADGDQSPNSTISISVDDDTPTVSASGTQPTLTVDETVLATNATASFAGVFTDSFGADGPAVAGSITYALAITGGNGVASGLIDVATGSAIVLVNNAGVIEGHVGNAAGALAFTVSVDASGNVTLDQIRALQHPNPANPDDSVTLSADNLITLTQTITDKDGDQASATANIGQNLNFEDDGPSIGAGGTQPQLTVDETILATNATASFAGVFTPLFGADGAGTITYALSITGGDGTASGLIDVATGSAIVLVNNAGVIEGHVGNAAGALAFTVSVDASGNVTLDQIRALTHPNAADPDDSVTLSADNLVVLTATVTDKDGDQASAAANIGQNLNFEDDGPSIGAGGAQPSLTVDETVLATNATASFAGVFTPVFGADGAGTVTYALGITGGDGTASGLIDVATGSAIVLVNNAGVIEGHVGNAAGALAFTVSVDGSGNVTLDQIRALQHPNPANPDDSVTLSADNLVTLTATVTDKDGDQASATANIGQNLNFEDDGPSIGAGGTQPQLTVDETVLATNATASFAGVFTPAFGADGAGTVTYALGITGGDGTASGLTDVATGLSIVLVNNAGVIEGHVGNAAGALAFTVSVDASGNVTLDQIRALTHPNAANPDDSVTLSADNLITLTATVTDRDGDQASATANIGQNLNFEDDGPSAAIVTTGQSVSLDESVGNQVDSNDVTGPIAAFSGVANVGTDPDLAGPLYATNASALVASTGTTLGADGGTVAFSLNVSAAGVDSGLNTTAGQDIFLFKEGNVVVGRVGNGAGPAAFALAIDPVTGAVRMVEYMSIQHPNPANPDDSVSIANGAVLAVVTATDGDGDTSSASTPIGSLISFQDSGPVMTAASDINIQNSGDVAHTGTFAFNLGADGAATDNNVITAVTFSAIVNGTTVQTTTPLTQVSEDATTAVFNFSFTYSTGTGTATTNGVLTFNKVAGTYTVDLDNPIQGISILQTATGTLFQGYEFGTSNTDSSQPEISVTQIQGTPGTPLSTDLFLQFTSVSEPSSGTGDDALEVTSWVPGADNPPPVNSGGDTSWSAGQVFNQADGWVSTSGTANGTDGDTIQGGEVLDFTIVKGANPTGILAQPAAFGQASTMFLKFDGIGDSEDMIILLKLYDPVANTYTTKALMVQNADIQKGPGNGPGIFSGITLDNNDGLIIIEPNDYQEGNTNLVIVGAQIAGSDEGVTGTAINFSYGGVLGVASTGTQAFSTDTNDGPMKISSIGILAQTTTAQNAELTFNVTVTDGDGDSITQTVVADVTSSPDSSTPLVLGSGVTTINSALPPEPVDSESSFSSSSFSFSNDNQNWNPNGNGNPNFNFGTTGIVAGIVAASGLSSMSIAAAELNYDPSFDMSLQYAPSVGMQMVSFQSVDSGALGGLTFGTELREPANDLAELSSSSHSFDDFAGASNGLDAQQFGDAVPAYEPNFAINQAPAFDATALIAAVPSIGMPSAELLLAAQGLTGGVQQGGSAEQILADALGAGAAPTVDAMLQALPGGIGDLAVLTNGASPAGDSVPAWDIAGAGAFGDSADMMFRMDASTFHHDAVQPVVNG